jgi:uncharacterized membrane protein YfcA
MEIGVAAFVVIAVAVLLGAAIQGAIGFGMNLVSVPVFALVAPEVLPVAAIILGIPISITMLRHEHADLDRSGLGWLIGGRVPGTVVGAWFVAVASTTSLRIAVALFVLAIVAASVAAPAIPVRPGTQVGAGAVSGITGTTAGIGGPPVALLYQRHPGPAMRSTLAATFFVGTFLSLGMLGVTGSIEWHAVVVGAVLAPVVLAGTLIGRRFHGMLERGWLRPAVLAFSVVSALWVLLDALL